MITKERPIIFNSEMVRAILDGRKTQTRRTVKGKGIITYAYMNEMLTGKFTINDGLGECDISCPYGQVGDRLWVRETFTLQTNDYPGCEDSEPPFNDGRPIKKATDGWEAEEVWYQPHYRATDPSPDLCCQSDDCRQCQDHSSGPHWKPSIHMPRWASRITLEITNIQVQRLQDISRSDAKAEGFIPSKGNGLEQSRGRSFGNAELAFRDTWESIYGPDSWNRNPWVWVIEFKRV